MTDLAHKPCPECGSRMDEVLTYIEGHDEPHAVRNGHLCSKFECMCWVTAVGRERIVRFEEKHILDRPLTTKE